MRHRAIVVLTGAGISAESGLATFRGAGGRWENQPVEQVATPEAFARDPDRVHRFYNMRRRQLLAPSIQPNPAHEALARLEREHAGEFLLITQNIDDLHERAGSRAVVHMHGELLKCRCTGCGGIRAVRDELTSLDRCAICGRGGTLRPHVVWFGEVPFAMEAICAELERCDLFVAIGTSGHVYPAAGFVQLARAAGAYTVEINLEPSVAGSAFHERHCGSAGVEVPAFVSRLLGT